MPETSDRCSYGLAIKSGQAYAYNEETFAYLLQVQRRRSERADRPFRLLLVDLKEEPGQRNCIDASVARLLFSGLWRALRENDLIGWYATSYVAGAVLTEVGAGPPTETSAVIVQRVRQVLDATVPSAVAARLQVRVCQIPPRLSS